MPNLSVLSVNAREKFYACKWYALGRFDQADGTTRTPNASEVAEDFAIFCHDDAPGQAIADAWETYAAGLREWHLHERLRAGPSTPGPRAPGRLIPEEAAWCIDRGYHRDDGDGFCGSCDYAADI